MPTQNGVGDAEWADFLGLRSALCTPFRASSGRGEAEERPTGWARLTGAVEGVRMLVGAAGIVTGSERGAAFSDVFTGS